MGLIDSWFMTAIKNELQSKFCSTKNEVLQGV